MKSIGLDGLKIIFWVALATLLRALLDPVLGAGQPYILYFAALTAVAWSSGWKPAMAALVLGFIAGDYFFAAPRGSLIIADRAHLVSAINYFAVGLIIVLFARTAQAERRRSDSGAALALEQKEALEREIERRLRVEAALMQRERAFAMLMENSPDIVGRLDADLRYLYVSPMVGRYWGVDAADCIGRSGEETGMPPAFWQPFAAACREAFAGGHAVRRELLSSTPEQDRYLEIRLIPERAPDGAVVSLLLIAADVTERRRAEQALRESEARLNAILQATTAIIYLMSADSRFVHINRGFEQYLGLTQAEVQGKSVYDLFPAAIAEAFERNNRQVLAENDVLEFEETAPHADGIHVYASVKAPLYDAHGRPVGVVGVSTDITDRKRMEEQLRAADRRKDEFLATLAHELRNPLAPIRNALEILKLAADDRALRQGALLTLERQVRQMVRLIEDLLDLSRVTHDTLELRKTDVELAAVIDHAVEACRPLLDKKRQRLELDLPPEPVHVSGDAARLAQVLCNVLANAGKYSEPGGVIELGCRLHGERVEVTVSDDGIGIPASVLPRIFDMFMQVDRGLERTEGGLGIGLALARRLVEMHGGSIAAFSDGPGCGSRFVISLPLAPARARAPAGADAPAPGAAPPHAGRRILVVDDNVDSAESLMLLLELQGDEVYTAHDGQQALERAERLRPDIVLLDIGLPKMNGYEVAEAIRNRPWGRRPLLVALTGWGQADDRRRSAEAGFDRHLVKPVDPKALVEALAAVGQDRGVSA